MQCYETDTEMLWSPECDHSATTKCIGPVIRRLYNLNLSTIPLFVQVRIAYNTRKLGEYYQADLKQVSRKLPTEEKKKNIYIYIYIYEKFSLHVTSTSDSGIWGGVLESVQGMSNKCFRLRAEESD
jgi:hypothetical protein